MSRYSKTMIVVHWLTALLIIAAYVTGEGGRHVRENPPLLHFSLGLTVLVLLVPRLVSRLTGGAPAVDDSQGPWMTLAAKLGHLVLYAFIIALPLSGWYAASRLGAPVTFWGIGLPSIAAPVQGAPGLIADLHETGGTVILILAGLHALMALYHHFVLRDETLRRMAPM